MSSSSTGPETADLARRRTTPRGAVPSPGRLALVLTRLSVGGAERVASALAARWAAEGRKVTVITLAGLDPRRYPMPPEVEYVPLGIVGDSPNPLVGLRRAVGRIRKLRGSLRRHRPDAVVSFGDRTNVLTLLAALGCGFPVFVSERTDPRVADNAWTWRLARRLLYPLAAAVVVQTESVAAWARGCSSKVQVVPNFVARPARMASPGAAHGPRTLVALGRLERVKGFDLLCRAFALIAGRHPEWTLTIAGEGSERAALEALVAELGIARQVSLPGRVDDPVPLLAAAHAFALSSRREGFPNALLEAMACGLPAVAFDCASGPAEIVTHAANGLLVPPGDVDGLARALDRLLRDDAERERLGRAARQVAVRFAPERVLALWSSLLGGEDRS